MRVLHLTEEEIQQYAMDKSKCEADTLEHVHLCEECKTQATVYEVLFASIKKQPGHVFDFDLSALVLSKLPETKSGLQPDSFLIYLLVLVVIFLTGALFYIFRRDLPGLFAGITPLLTYLILTAVVTVLVVLGIDMYKNYQKKMTTLDFY